MSLSPTFVPGAGQSGALGLARVLLVHGELAARLTLKTILEAGGYSVEAAGTPEEALSKLDESVFELVLSDSEFGDRPAGRNVLAYARVKAYRPATALVTDNQPRPKQNSGGRGRHRMAIHMEDVPKLLESVAELIGMRASRRYRPVRAAV